MERHGLCSKGNVVVLADAGTMVQGLRCTACATSTAAGVIDVTPQEHATADHRLQPCRCVVCRTCADAIAEQDRPSCPVCDARVRWMTDERALLETGWRTARTLAADQTDQCGFCVARKL